MKEINEDTLWENDTLAHFTRAIDKTNSRSKNYTK
jgi:hypothetical protein